MRALPQGLLLSTAAPSDALRTAAAVGR